jgi:hypothetical protein
LHLDWPVQIYYRREFPCIDRATPGFSDDELGSEYDDPADCPNLINAELANHDVVIWDRPACSLAPGKYVKYEFQSAYLLRDPRPGRRDEQIGYRRFVVFVYGTVDHLEMTQTRPPDWDQDWAKALIGRRVKLLRRDQLKGTVRDCLRSRQYRHVDGVGSPDDLYQR